MTGRLALHGGGEYVAGDEAAMDALLAEAVEAVSYTQHRAHETPENL
jgi:hypothetical protein